LKTFAPSLWLLPLSLAQNRPEARDLLSRADTAIFSARTVRLAPTQSQGFVGSQALRLRSSLCAAAKDAPNMGIPPPGPR